MPTQSPRALVAFLAVLVSAPALGVDTDNDGLDDATEALVGTDPLVWHTDEDSVSDGAEDLVLRVRVIRTDVRVAPAFCRGRGR